MGINSKPKVCFEITVELDKLVKELPRSFNLSQMLREALEKILKDRTEQRIERMDENK